VSRENVELVRGSLEHFLATGELDWSVQHEAIEVYEHDIPDAGVYRGRDGVER
jgi:hypothetical protein